MGRGRHRAGRPGGARHSLYRARRDVVGARDGQAHDQAHLVEHGTAGSRPRGAHLDEPCRRGRRQARPAAHRQALPRGFDARADQGGARLAAARRMAHRRRLRRLRDRRELTVAGIGAGARARALPVIEIRAPGGNYDYRNKYFTDETEYLCPAPLSRALTRRVQELSVAAYRALDCEGWGRVDLMLDAEDRPFLLELNTSPGMTDHSLVPMAARAEGMDFDTLVLRILADASLKVTSRRPGL